MSDVWTKLRDGTLAAGSAALDMANVETLRLAVTGLSGAGKTVFLVSVISNLLAMTKGTGGIKRDSLPQLRKAMTNKHGQSRLLGIEIEPSGVQRIPRFAYEDFRDELALGGAPKWPRSTDRTVMLTLRLHVQPESILGRFKGAITGPRIIRLELLDYPGEWLVDLPLLEQAYEAWSTEVLLQLHQAPRAARAGEFLTFLGALSPNAPAEQAVAIHGFHLYRDLLRRCREKDGLRWLQPGRFLMPGSWDDVPFLHFFPWTGAPDPLRGTLGALLRDRFEVYKKEIRKAFFDPHFSAFNRQVVLVDVLGALFAGRTAFEDTRMALGSIGSSYTRLLEGGWLSGREIKHVAFVATKADHVDDLQRNNLLLTLKTMVQSAPGAAKASVQPSFHVVSSIRCTTDADFKPTHGPVQRVVVGVPLGGILQKPFFAGNVPAGLVPETFWNNDFFEMPKLRPPEFPGGDSYPIEHLNLDGLLVDLIGDAL